MSARVTVRRPLASDEGAIIIQAALAMVVLLGFAAFVVDYGILWLSRGQAQNAADAGAVAGAIARAYDDPGPGTPPAGGVVEQSAALTAAANLVWGPGAQSAVSFDCPPDVAGGRCVRVDVFRDGTSGSTPLPTMFGPVLGITSQGVRAMAVAQVAVGNSTLCMKPWAIPDKWNELNPVPKPLEPTDDFERYDASGAVLPAADEYVAPDPGSTGTGLTFSSDLGLAPTIAFADEGGSDPISPEFLLPIVLAGGNAYRDNIAGCNGRLSAVGDFFQTDPVATSGVTVAEIANSVNLDAGAAWNSGSNTVQGSCAPGCASISPRLVAIAVFDVDLYQQMRVTGNWSACPVAPRCVKVTNIVGFFIARPTSDGAQGYLATYPGLVSSGNLSLVQDSSFLAAVTLVR